MASLVTTGTPQVAAANGTGGGDTQQYLTVTLGTAPATTRTGAVRP